MAKRQEIHTIRGQVAGWLIEARQNTSARWAPILASASDSEQSAIGKFGIPKFAKAKRDGLARSRRMFLDQGEPYAGGR